ELRELHGLQAGGINLIAEQVGGNRECGHFCAERPGYAALGKDHEQRARAQACWNPPAVEEPLPAQRFRPYETSQFAVCRLSVKPADLLAHRFPPTGTSRTCE